MKRILTCLDDSPRAPKVLAAAVDLAERTGAKLVLFRAVGLPPELGDDIHELSPNALVETLLGRARDDLVKTAATLPPALVEATIAHVGVPWDIICREASKLDCDLVVIGSHGYSGLDRIIGTTAGKVVNHADRSVLVVR